MTKFFAAIAALAMSVSAAAAQTQPVSAGSIQSFPKNSQGNYDAQGQYSCTDAHVGVCMDYCKSLRMGEGCKNDCDGRLKQCLATGAYLIRQWTKTYAVNLKRQ